MGIKHNGAQLKCKAANETGWTNVTADFGQELVIYLKANSNGSSMGYRVWQYIDGWEQICSETFTADTGFAECNITPGASYYYVAVAGSPSVYRAYSGGTLVLSDEETDANGNQVTADFFTLNSAKLEDWVRQRQCPHDEKTVCYHG